MLLPIAVFLIVTALLYGLALPFIRGRRNPDHEVLAGGRLRPLIFGPLTAALAGVMPSTTVTKARITKDLRRAGYYHRFALAEFLSFRNAMVIGWVFLIGALVVVGADPENTSPTFKLLIAGFLGAILLYSLPVLVMRSRANARVQRIRFALPDALDMTTMCTTGGLPLQQALAEVSQQLHTTHPDLAMELKIMGRQMEAGSLDGALVQFANRIDTPEIQALTAMFSQTHRQGSSVAASFQEFADGLRRGQRQRAEEQGNKTAVKMLLPLVLCLAPPVYMMLLTPAVIELRRFMVQENRPGGALTPASLDLTQSNVTDQFAGSFPAGEAPEDTPPQ